MTEDLLYDHPVAFLSESNSAVFFSAAATDAGVYPGRPKGKGTAVPVTKLQNVLDVAYWGEDNRFPQNIEQQMAYCGIGKAALDWKARALYGNGIIPGRIIDYNEEGKEEVFQPIKPSSAEGKIIYKFLDAPQTLRFFLEYLQDWTWFSNCFPEAIFSKDGKTITGWVHQESCDSRYKQMNTKGEITSVFLSKLWGLNSDQYAKFDPKKRVKGLVENRTEPIAVDNEFVKELHCIDMYNALDSTKTIAEKLVQSKGLEGFKSAILPVNYPSVNKSYYQVPYWDGARLSGWVEIASKIPGMLRTLYNKAFKIKYHIQVPETYFERTVGKEQWATMDAAKRVTFRKDLLKKMDEFLSGEENAYKTFLNVFDVDPISKNEYGLIKIQAVEDKVNLDKELLTQSAADVEILIAMQVHPTLFSAGMTGSMFRSGGGSGSDIREAFLVYNALLNLERKVLLEPINLMRDYNRVVGGMSEWAEDITFRFRDTVLTTLDKGMGTEKVVS